MRVRCRPVASMAGNNESIRRLHIPGTPLYLNQDQQVVLFADLGVTKAKHMLALTPEQVTAAAVRLFGTR